MSEILYQESPAEMPPDSSGPPSRLDAFVTGGAYGVLAVAGAMIGVFGSFYQGGGIGPIPIVAIAFSLLNFGAFGLAGIAMGTKLGAAVPAVAWLIVAIFLSSKRPEGDLVISSSVASYVFLIGGAIGAVAAVARTRSPARRLAALRDEFRRMPWFGGALIPADREARGGADHYDDDG